MGFNSGFKGLMHGMAGGRYGHGMLCVNPPLVVCHERNTGAVCLETGTVWYYSNPSLELLQNYFRH